MKLDSKKLPRGQVELTIELSAEEYEPYLHQAASQISQEIKISGFRPGKATLDAVKSHIGENEIWQKAFEPAVKKTLVKALEENNFLTVGSPQIDVVKLAAGNPVIYKAVVSILPNVKLGDYQQIKIKSRPVDVKDEDVDKQLGDIAKSRAKESAVDRTAKIGDRLEIDFEVFMDKIPIDHGAQKKFSLVMGEKMFIPGFEDHLAGMKAGESKNFALSFPKEYHQKNLAGKPADFKVNVNSVFDRQVPPIDDEFARQLGDFKDLSALKAKIKENFFKERQGQETQRQEEGILEQLIRASEFGEIPDILISSETRKMIEELEQNLSAQGVKVEDYLTHLKKTKEELALDFMPGAVKRVKSALVIRELVKKENIKMMEDELEEKIHESIELYGSNPEAEKYFHSQQYQQYLSNILVSRKALETLKKVMIE